MRGLPLPSPASVQDVRSLKSRASSGGVTLFVLCGDPELGDHPGASRVQVPRHRPLAQCRLDCYWFPIESAYVRFRNEKRAPEHLQIPKPPYWLCIVRRALHIAPKRRRCLHLLLREGFLCWRLRPVHPAKAHPWLQQACTGSGQICRLRPESAQSASWVFLCS